MSNPVDNKDDNPNLINNLKFGQQIKNKIKN